MLNNFVAFYNKSGKDILESYKRQSLDDLQHPHSVWRTLLIVLISNNNSSPLKRFYAHPHYYQAIDFDSLISQSNEFKFAFFGTFLAPIDQGGIGIRFVEQTKKNILAILEKLSNRYKNSIEMNTDFVNTAGVEKKLQLLEKLPGCGKAAQARFWLNRFDPDFIRNSIIPYNDVTWKFSTFPETIKSNPEKEKSRIDTFYEKFQQDLSSRGVNITISEIERISEAFLSYYKIPTGNSQAEAVEICRMLMKHIKDDLSIERGANLTVPAFNIAAIVKQAIPC